MDNSKDSSFIEFNWKKIVSLCIQKRKREKLTLAQISEVSDVPVSTILIF